MTLPRNNFCPEQVHLQLDQKFYRPVEPAEFPQHHLRYRNHEAAASVGLDDLDEQSWAKHFAKFELSDQNVGRSTLFCLGCV